jgi:uncharacterized protein YbjT (DUF2867 family)
LSAAPSRVLVTGATGYVGGRLVPRLLERGHAVRVLVRDPSRLSADRWPGVEVVRGDVLDPATLEPALAGCDLTFYLVHAMAGGEHGFAERDRRAAEQFAAAAARAGVSRLIYLGGLGDPGAGLSPHLVSRQQTGAALASAGVPVVELRAAVIVGSGSISFEMIRYLVERVPVLIAPRWTATRCQPIAIRDVLAYLLAAAALPDDDVGAGRIVDIGGRDVLTYGQMMLACARVRGLRRWLVNVPVLTPRLSSLWVDLVTPIPAALARPLIEGLRSEVVVRGDLARTLFPGVVPLGYEEAVRLAFDRDRAGALETVWSGSSSSSRDRAPQLVDSSQREGLIVERRELRVAAAAEDVYAVFAGLGGRRGWLYGDALWAFRGLLDRLVGGPGMRRGRRDPDELRAGDACDFWRVLSAQPGRHVRLGAEMKLPGRAWLELSVEPAPRAADTRARATSEAGTPCSLLRTAAIFEPRGLPGLAYWYALLPAHKLLFAGLVREIARRAEARAAARGGAVSSARGARTSGAPVARK